MDALILFIKETYGITVLLFLEGLFTAILGFARKNKAKVLELTPILALLSAMQGMVCFTCLFFDLNLTAKVNNIAIYIFIVSEFIIIYHLLFKTIKSKWLQNIMYLFFMSFIGLSIFTYFTADFSNTIPSLFNITNTIFLAVPCLFYFYEIFKKPALNNLSDDPSFWIATGYLFMTICTLPFYLLEHYIFENINPLYHQICMLNTVFYCFIFALIIKSFSCPQTIVK